MGQQLSAVRCDLHMRGAATFDGHVGPIPNVRFTALVLLDAHRVGLYCRGLPGSEADGVDTVAKRGIRFGRVLFWLLLIVIAALAAWTAFSLSWSYSEGDRAGVLQKFSKKGWICKTYEGELALYVVGGVAPQIWHFSTRDEDLAKQLADAVGKNIQLHYTEHRAVPTRCFADTPYFARSFRVVAER